MANEIITTLHPDHDPDTNLYPNIKKENIPNGSIDDTKLSDDVNNMLANAIANISQPKFVTTLPTTDQGLVVYTDGYLYRWDGTQYVTTNVLYQAPQLDDDTNIKLNMIPEIANAIGLVYLKNSKSLVYPNTDMLTNISLKKDVPYIINISTLTSFQNTIYCYLYDSNNTQLATAHLSGSTSRTITFTPTQDYEGCYLRCVITWAGLVGVNTTTIISVDDNYILEMDKEISDLISNCGFIKPNLLPSKFTSHTYNGVVWTQNSDGSVTGNGTATGLTFTNQSITLPRGKYKASIGNIGATTDGYHGFIIRADQSYQYVENKDVEFEITTDTETFSFWLRFTSGTNADVTFYPMIRNADVYNDKFVKYGDYQIIYPLSKMINNTKFNWSGKKINVIGDSIVQGSYGNFVNVIGGILNLSVTRNYGVGGSRLASTDVDPTYPPVVTRYTDMDNDADIILVHVGTNDYSAQVPLGDDDSVDITTFNGALNVLLDGLRNKYPTKLIIIDTILSRYNENAFTIKVSDYNNAIKNACLRKHIICYDINYYSGFDFVKDYYTHYLTNDGLHPNQEGANIMGRKISGFININ